MLLNFPLGNLLINLRQAQVDPEAPRRVTKLHLITYNVFSTCIQLSMCQSFRKKPPRGGAKTQNNGYGRRFKWLVVFISTWLVYTSHLSPSSTVILVQKTPVFAGVFMVFRSDRISEKCLCGVCRGNERPHRDHRDQRQDRQLRPTSLLLP